MNGKMKGLWCRLSMLLLVCLLFSGALSMEAVAATEIPTIDGYTTGDAHDAGGGYSQLTYSNVSLTQMKSYEEKLLSDGYTLYDQREIQNGTKTNRFATYVKGEMMIHLNLFAPLSSNQFHVIYGPSDKLVPNTQVGNYTAVVTPSVAIIERSDLVLCMVVQLADGSYYIIDGGRGYTRNSFNYPAASYRNDPNDYCTITPDHKKDMQTLLAYLQDTNRDGKTDTKDTRPKVTWMITHADVDHIHLPYVFMKTYSSKFDLKAVYYNFPNYREIGLSDTYTEENVKGVEDNAKNFLKYTRTYFPYAKEYIYHTGQTVDLPGCTLEFLYTPEDLYPNAMETPNHTCGMWRFCFDNGKTFLVTGDAEVSTNKQAATVLGSYLQSDMLQVIHHGYNGGTTEFYSAVDPDVCFWPSLDIALRNDKQLLGTYSGFSFNKILRNGERTHYAASITHTVFLPTLRYDANGGTGTTAQVGAMYDNNTATEGDTPKGIITVADNNFAAPKNKLFSGWATTPDGDVQYRPGDQIEIETDTVLYAVWQTLDGHTVKHKNAVAATFYSEGNIEYWYCSSCDLMWLDAECTQKTDPEGVKLPMLESFASIGDVKYGSLEDAIAAARQTPEADTIILSENASISTWAVVNTEVTLVAEKPITIFGAETQTGSMFRVIDGGKLTIQGSESAPITIVAGVNTTNLLVTNGGETILANVKLVGNENTVHTSNNKARGIFNDGGTITVKNSEIANMKGDSIYILSDGVVNLDDVTIINSGRYGIKDKGVLNITNTEDADNALTISGSGNNAIDIEDGGKAVSHFESASIGAALIRLIDNLEDFCVRVGGIWKLTNVSTTE